MLLSEPLGVRDAPALVVLYLAGSHPSGRGLCNVEGKRNGERAKACENRSIYAKAGKRDSTKRLST